MEVNVKILELLPSQSGSSSKGEWVRNGFVGETEGEYPKKMAFDVLGQERWDKMRSYLSIGSVVKVSFDISSRCWQGKWFTSLSAFSVYAGASAPASSPQVQPSPVSTPPAPEKSDGKGDDLPF